jgi:sugar/nucleoside kinase (ribokinase family)
MEVLGGGLVHSAAGMAIWGERAGLVACAGRDLPESAQRRLRRDFDLQGVIWLDLPQARAWQLFEWDGQRREVFRVDVLEPFIYDPGPDQVPAAYHGPKGVYLLRDAAQLPAWRALYPDATLLWEPLQQYMIPDNAAEFRAALPSVDIVSPNWLEAEAIYQINDPGQLVRAMLDDGAEIVALRMGPDGSMIGKRDMPETISVPAVPVPVVVDQTGAGNTYCGSFLVGWLKTGNLLDAGCYAAVAASFALETIGVADPPLNVRAVRDARYQRLHARLQHPVA